jgi:predicted DNA-binding protein (MmcQ/YjbR family)
MDAESLANLALSLAEVREEQPFGPDVDVYKVAGKIFVILAPTNAPPTVALKCDPELALELRAEHAAVTPGYHLNKKHWNTVQLDGSVPRSDLEDMVRHSYDRVVRTLPKATRDRLLADS